MTLACYQSPVIHSGRRLIAPPGVAAGANGAGTVSPGGHAGLRLVVEREWPFLVREGSQILSGQIDRLVLWYDGDRLVAADVIDFKTDRVAADNPVALADRVEHYRPQLAAYCRALTRLYRLAADHVSARLVFVEPGIVVAL